MNDIGHVAIKKCFNSSCKNSVVFIFSNENGVFPDDLNIGRVQRSPWFIKGMAVVMAVFPCFSEIMKCIMSNRLYKHLIKNKILYFKQLGFQNSHSTDHAIVQSVDQIFESFNDIIYACCIQ